MRGDTVGIPTLKKDGKLESENNLKAEILNDQFKSVSTQSVPDLSNPCMSDIKVSVEGVTKLLCDINPNKASGPDEIPARILNVAAEEITPALSVIFQRSLDSGEIPSPWLRANITPLFKKGERTDVSNYHPVSLTCTICSKLLEHIIHANVMDHFDKYSILTDKQHGFRSKNSCESQLILTVHDLAKSLDSRSQIDVVIMFFFFFFSIAFDSVPHNHLLFKLNRYGIQNNTNRWISNFLKHCVQRVVVGGEPRRGPTLFRASLRARCLDRCCSSAT